ncbi:MAG: hypothetical protein RLZZ59_845 [Pseudomonadota bacterium]|jgi:MurNAc alpha-1-phosphate uridylyltransferase
METIVIFSAGKGTRMGSVSDATPKPLIRIRGKPLLQHALEITKTHKFDRIIINTHHLHTQIEEFIKGFREENPFFPDIILEYEECLLETAGTIKKLNKLYDLGERIFTINSDVIIKHKGNVFDLMIKAWESSRPDILLLLQDTKNAFGYTGNGDFNLENDGSINKDGPEPYPYMFAGMHILNPQKISQIADNICSFREFYPGIGKFSSQTICKAITMNGLWYHATRPEDIEVIESLVKNSD